MAIEIDWDSGDGLKVNPVVEKVIEQITQMANKHNDNNWCLEAEMIAKDALSTALYNPKLLADILVALGDDYV